MKSQAVLCCILSIALSTLSATALPAPAYLSFQTEDETNNIEIFRAASPLTRPSIALTAFH
jgi:hypothetical protein